MMDKKERRLIKEALRAVDPSQPAFRMIEDANWQSTIAAWPTMPANHRFELVKRVNELSRGEAIAKDRCCKRAKYSLEGFFGLELALEELHALSGSKTATEAQLTKARERIAELKSKFASDQEYLDLDEHYGPWCQRQHGKTVAEYLGAVWGIEQAMNRDVTEGLILICDHMKWDFVKVITLAAQGVQFGDADVRLPGTTWVPAPARQVGTFDNGAPIYFDKSAPERGLATG